MLGIDSKLYSVQAIIGVLNNGSQYGIATIRFAFMNTASTLLFDLLACFSRLFQSELRHRALALDLQPVHLQTLLYLRDANRYSNMPNALAEYLGSTKGTVSQSLLLLYRKGLIERYSDDHDRRVVRLRLTVQATELLRDQDWAREWEGVESAFPATQIAAAGTTLGQVLRELQKRRGGRSFGVCMTCDHFCREATATFRCGLTAEPLDSDDSRKICREHKVPPATGAVTGKTRP
jgi:DNA-binding MarR family transcriptional regulator